MATLKEFEDALREQGMTMALAVLERLKERDRARRSSVSPARRLTGQKMTPDLARRILELHATTGMTQQEIAFKVGVNQGRVNEVIKRRKWLDDDPGAIEARARDRAKARIASGPRASASLRRPRPRPDRCRGVPGPARSATGGPTDVSLRQAHRLHGCPVDKSGARLPACRLPGLRFPRGEVSSGHRQLNGRR